ncbi:alpha/beta hydrolase [Actinoplanes sp. CA-252034]|uniref:alpha/beta hydrolase n=1 Tax=Actinoplanes sp. CA-252034 TaxID=3239906 RepID=UPI003D997A96
MELSRIAPELRKPVRRFPAIPVESGLFRRLSRLALPLMRSPVTPGVLIEQAVPGAPGVRVHRPAEIRSRAALLWIHGGGLVMGAAKQDDRMCGATAAELGMVVVAADYRLAPDFPFLTPLDDCHTAWTWLLRNAARLGVDPSRVIVGGQSAGGGLAAALAQRLCDEGGVQPVAQWLFCPMLDDRTAARRELDGIGHRIWNNRHNRYGWGAYLGAEPGRERAKGPEPDDEKPGGRDREGRDREGRDREGREPPRYAVPARREDLTGLPPAWIGVGDVDLFHDEDVAYADRLRAAGVPATFHAVPGAPHGFEAWAPNTTISRDFVRTGREWLSGFAG